MKNAVIAILIVVLGVVGFIPLKRSDSSRGETDAVSRRQTVEVRSLDIQFDVTVAGIIEPAEQVSVRPEINGRIAHLNVDIGDKVEKGAVLFTLDDQELQNEASSRETEIARAQLELEQAGRNFERNQQLYQQNLISEELHDEARMAFELAENTLERTHKTRLIIKEKLSKTQIRAPFDCTVLLRPVSVGQAVSGAGGASGGTEVLAIADLKQMVISAHVNQVDVVRLRVGQDVAIRVEAIAGVTAKGKVERISPQAVVINGRRGFAARILLTDLDARIQPGMTANVTIPVHSAKGVTAVPLASIFTERETRHVFVETSAGPERREVELGVADYQHVEIRSGLSVGDVVWLEEPPEGPRIDPKSSAN